ncbi:hypothetical protein [Clostridium sp. C8-1-8]|uniref:hypothetical protein n=1 Tax=Clostridium sp. C8-1-8 TaxID=2698831 RepID=UPI001369145A|nr:hypothetical protein [Clostridium sp. C8-1-8]
MKYKEYVEKIMNDKYDKENTEYFNRELLYLGSVERGYCLYNSLTDNDGYGWGELNYYLFCEWWDSIDVGHEKFYEIKDTIREWIEDAEVEVDFKNLEFDNEGYTILYRGEHEKALHLGLSWTTSEEVAILFAHGLRIRQQSKEPRLLKAKVHKDDILAVFNDRNENEVLASEVEVIDEIYFDKPLTEEVRERLRKKIEIGN